VSGPGPHSLPEGMMHKLIGSGLALCAFLALVSASTASAAPRMPTSTSYPTRPAIHPRAVWFSEDSSTFLAGYVPGPHPYDRPGNIGRLDWTTWNSSEGKARGGAWIDNQKPNVGAGTYYVYRVKVDVYRPVHGVFTRMFVSSRHRLHNYGKRFTLVARRISGGWSWFKS
jgi:hypothetical protein